MNYKECLLSLRTTKLLTVLSSTQYFLFLLLNYLCIVVQSEKFHTGHLLFICCLPLQVTHSKFGIQIKVVKNCTVLLAREDGAFLNTAGQSSSCWLRDFVSPTNRNMLFTHWFSGLKNFVEKDFIWNLSVYIYMIRLFTLNLDFTRGSHMHHLSH